MCCRHSSHNDVGHSSPHLHSPCVCGGHEDIRPCFWTKEEKIAYLEDYLDDLKNKKKSVDERIATLKEEG